ncbi:MAG: hypothetical protein NT135_02370 [Candidatus Berkelbacteria bacterium]|nr:hypothetical protein [Candidatus Berkelbacteria bacterium]
MKQDYVCTECGHQYEELGGGKCYVCGGNVIPIDEVGQDEPEYPDDLMEDQETKPEDIEDDWEQEKVQ